VKRAIVAAVAALAACAAVAAHAQPPADPRLLTVAEYQQELRAIDTALATPDLAAASARAEALRSSRVALDQERIAVDPALVDAVATVRPETAQAARVRVRAVLRGLDAQPGAAGAGDVDLLRRAQRADQPQALPSGGQVGGMPLQPSFPQRFLDTVASIWRSITDAARRFRDWLAKLWPRRAVQAAAADVGTPWMVAVLVAAVAVVMALLAVAALRRSAPNEKLASEPVPASQRDADPLSREQDEWEAYAAQLAAAGRMREAIRAWYHAVLVGLFRAGLLHHHKGRTNWEYVARVPPESAWRPELIRLTRRFDREWYGAERSAAESLRECAAEARSILRQVRAAMAA